MTDDHDPIPQHREPTTELSVGTAAGKCLPETEIVPLQGTLNDPERFWSHPVQHGQLGARHTREVAQRRVARFRQRTCGRCTDLRQGVEGSIHLADPTHSSDNDATMARARRPPQSPASRCTTAERPARPASQVTSGQQRLDRRRPSSRRARHQRPWFALDADNLKRFIPAVEYPPGHRQCPALDRQHRRGTQD